MKKVEEKKQIQKEKSDRAARAVVKFLRISPRKMRLVINPIRHQHPERAFQILMTLQKKAARMVEKILKTAVANAKVLGMDEARLTIADVRADGGPVMKRFMERSMGRANRILKRTTHLTLILKEGDRQWKISKTADSKEAENETQSGKKTSGRKSASGGKKTAGAGA